MSHWLPSINLFLPRQKHKKPVPKSQNIAKGIWPKREKPVRPRAVGRGTETAPRLSSSMRAEGRPIALRKIGLVDLAGRNRQGGGARGRQVLCCGRQRQGGDQREGGDHGQHGERPCRSGAGGAALGGGGPNLRLGALHGVCGAGGGEIRTQVRNATRGIRSNAFSPGVF